MSPASTLLALGALGALGALALPSRAHAQPTPPPAPPSTTDTPPTGTTTTPGTATSTTSTPPAAASPPLADRVETLEDSAEDTADELEDLRSQVKDLEERLASSRPPISPSAMNPAMTAFINGIGRWDDRAVYTPGGDRIDDRLILRSLEVDLRAAVDPFADAVATFSLEGEPGGGFEADLEEAYVVVKQLPILDAAPLGLKLKLGRFRAPFGTANRIHLHDLPWTTRPLPVTALLGSENGSTFEAGFSAIGADAEMILPELIPGVVMEVNADVLDGGGAAVSAPVGDGHRHLGYLGRWNAFYTAKDAHDFNLGASAYVERGDQYARLYGVDLTYKWKPVKAGEFHSAVLGGEIIWADRAFVADGAAAGAPLARTTPMAWYAFGQYQLSWHTYLGARYDVAESPVDGVTTTRVAAAYLSYYTSEFLRFRAGYEHRWSDDPADDGANTFLTEVNVVFGSHPTEPYWVNR
jgi:hypothetical protein